MEGTEGADILKACRAVPDPPSVLLVTTPASAGAALEAMRLGASDYVSKPVDPRELAHRIGLVLDLRRVRRECRALAGEVRRRHGLAPPIGDSPIMQDFLARARKASASSRRCSSWGRPESARTSSHGTSSPPGRGRTRST